VTEASHHINRGTFDAAQRIQAERRKRTMSYAVFKDDEKLSRTFPIKEETLKKADGAGLVDTVKGKPPERHHQSSGSEGRKFEIAPVPQDATLT
jgi:hypothetical protein